MPVVLCANAFASALCAPSQRERHQHLAVAGHEVAPIVLAFVGAEHLGAMAGFEFRTALLALALPG